MDSVEVDGPGETQAGSVFMPQDGGMRTKVSSQGALLEVFDLHVVFQTPYGLLEALRGLSYSVDAGETLAVIGESGSGKSVSMDAVIGLIKSPPGFITKGEIMFRGENLLKVSRSRMRAIRGSEIALVIQDALSSLNPALTVGAQLEELFRVHRGVSSKQARIDSLELLDRVHIPGAASRLKDYPHQFSGGMRQRVLIALAIALEPKLLIADEPTTALDVTVQAQILELLKELQVQTRMGLILITHDIGVAAQVADRAVIMYAGQSMESGPTSVVLSQPRHPYTRLLIDTLPTLERKGERLTAMTGSPPDLQSVPSGCSFHPRCPLSQQVCADEVPPLAEIGDGRTSRCHFWARTPELNR